MLATWVKTLYWWQVIIHLFMIRLQDECFDDTEVITSPYKPLQNSWKALVKTMLVKLQSSTLPTRKRHQDSQNHCEIELCRTKSYSYHSNETFYKVLSIFFVNFSHWTLLEVETEIYILKMWSNFDPIPRNSNPGLGPQFSFLHKTITLFISKSKLILAQV